MKKTMSTVYLPLVCLAVILSSARGSTPVFDSDGDEVRAGVEYKIYSLISPGHVDVALKLERTGNKPCPLDVVLAGFAECFSKPCGLPLTFHPEEGSLVTDSVDVTIKFQATTECPGFTVWHVARDESINREYVSTRGFLGNLEYESWFRFEPVRLIGGDVYKLVYCPRNLTTSICGALGFGSQDNDPRLFVLGLGGTPFQFIIRKVLPTLKSVV